MRNENSHNVFKTKLNIGVLRQNSSIVLYNRRNELPDKYFYNI